VPLVDLTPALGSPSEPSPDEPRTPFGTGDSNGDPLLSIAYSMRTVHTDNHRMTLMSDVRQEGPGPDPEAAKWHTAKVTNTAHYLSFPCSSYSHLRSLRMGTQG